MRPTRSAVEGTLADAAAVLAARAVEKRAASSAELLASLTGAGGAALQTARDYAAANPVLAHGLGGAALGAGAGGLGAAVGNLGRPERRRRSVLGAMATGGLAGAGVGAGLGAVRQSVAGAGGHAGKPAPGTFADADGRKLAIKPEAFQKRPGLAEDVAKATDATPTGPEAAASALYTGAKAVHEAAPISSVAVPAALGADLALNSDKLQLGERKFLGRRLPGMIDPRHSQLDAHLRGGVDAAVADPKRHGFDDDGMKRLLKDVQSAPGDALGKMNATPEGVPYSRTFQVPTGGHTVDFTTGTTTPRTADVTHGLTADDVQRLRGVGAAASAEAIGKNPRFKGRASTQPRLQRTIRGLLGGAPTREVPVGVLGSSGRWLPRLVGAAAAPLAEASIRGAFRRSAQRRSLDEILADLKRQDLVQPAEK